MKLKTKHFTKSPCIRFEKLKDPKLAEVFQARVIGKFAALGIFDSDIDTLVHSLKDEQLATAEGVLGRLREFAKSHRLTLANTFHPHNLVCF